MTGILAAANVQGIVRYCAQKKYLTDTEARAAMSANPVKGTDPAVDELARQAKNVGERGVMFVIAKSQGKDTKTLPAFALEDIAMRDQATPQDVCRKLVQAEEKGAEPAEGRKPDE